MWQDKLKEIIYILENSNVNEIEITFWGRKYRVKKNQDLLDSKPVSTDIPSTNQKLKPVKSEPSSKNIVDEGEKKILAPMPGTFYSGPSPDDSPFVSQGTHVKKGQVICIIEAMKIMNEIEAEYEGVIADILVNNSDPVEYNQPLFIIDPL